jgi:hypothetical protein
MDKSGLCDNSNGRTSNCRGQELLLSSSSSSVFKSNICMEDYIKFLLGSILKAQLIWQVRADG